jgi:hypothetical protein
MSLLREVPLPPPLTQQLAVKKTKRAPEYNQSWLTWHKETKDQDGILKTLDYKVPNCKKPYFVYKQSSGMTNFKRHVEMHQKRVMFQIKMLNRDKSKHLCNRMVPELTQKSMKQECLVK